jgi:hypothetical protein
MFGPVRQYHHASGSHTDATAPEPLIQCRLISPTSDGFDRDRKSLLWQNRPVASQRVYVARTLLTWLPVAAI